MAMQMGGVPDRGPTLKSSRSFDARSCVKRFCFANQIA
jgi:hypothetical protein